MFPDEHGEIVSVLGEAKRSPYGKLLAREVLREIPHCVVQPSGNPQQEGGDSDGYIQTDTTRLDVFAPSGVEVEEGAVVSIRGLEYVVVHVPFDYSVGRKPVLRRHKPKTVFTVERGEVSEQLT